MIAERIFPATTSAAPFIVGIGGTLKPQSSTEKAVRTVLRFAEAQGARIKLFAGADLDLPFYDPNSQNRTPATASLIAALREADAIVIASPGYHGGIAGIVKNALDYAEDMRADVRPYFDGRAIGCIATGAGWQGAASTLASLRSVAHALRGWPTPLGVLVNTKTPAFDAEDNCVHDDLTTQLRVMADQLLAFCKANAA